MSQPNQTVRSRVSFSYKSACLLALSAFASSQMQAMPAYNGASQLHVLNAQAIAADPVLQSVEIFTDHADTRTIYVSPSNRKAQAGVFTLQTTPACDILANQYALTYLVPSLPAAQWSEAALNGPVSGYFDFSYGNYLRSHRLIEELAKTISEIETIRAEHPEVVSEYETALAEFDARQKEKDEAQSEYDKFPNRIKELTQLLIAAGGDSELMAAYKSEIEATRTEFAEQAPRLVTAISETRAALAKASARLSEAKGSYNAAIPDEAVMTKRIAVLSNLFDSLQGSSKKVFDDNNKILTALETAGVGKASASYSIWGDEVARLKTVVADSNAHFDVWKLPIYDIRMNPSSTVTAASTVLAESSSMNAALNNAASLSFVNKASPPIADEVSTLPSAFAANGELLTTQVATLSNAGARTFENIITRGAYCTGSSERAYTNALASDVKATHASHFSLQVGVYKPRSEPVLAQSVALSYTYNLKNEPIDVSCTLDISKFGSWTSQTKSSGFLFWRKKKSTEERRMIQENGITCTNNLSDFGPGGAERTQEIMDRMSQEIGAEYILQYAKSYEITRYKAADLPNPGAAAEKMGTAMQTLCGGNVYCEVGSIVLKTGHDLFGSISGSSSGSDSFSGRISRNYKEHAYTSLPGSAVIDLTVSL